MTISTESQRDVEFFKIKLAAATNPNDRGRLQKQLDLLEDAVVVYHLTSPSRN